MHLGLNLERRNLAPIQGVSRVLVPSGAPVMPRKAQASKPACNAELVYRDWKSSPGVRAVVVRRDRLFEPATANQNIKICIKDAVHNQCVIKPVLYRMAADPSHPLPYLKPLLRESFGFKICKHFVFIC